jgi:hypothetical protein
VKLDVHAEAPVHALDGDLDVHLAHASEELLAGLLVAPENEGRVLLRQAAERLAHLLLVALGLRRDREVHDGLREAKIGKLDLGVLCEKEIARLRLLELGHGADVAGRERGSLLVLLALERQKLAEAFLAMRASVHERRVAGELAVEHAEDRDPAGERVGDRLEDERRGPTVCLRKLKRFLGR